MITTAITGKSLIGGVLKVDITYGGDVEAFTETYQVGNAKELEVRVRTRITKLNETLAYANTVAIGDYTLPSNIPTQAEIDQQQFLQDLSRWRSVKNVIDMGILTGSESQVVALLNKVKSEFKPAYLDIL